MERVGPARFGQLRLGILSNRPIESKELSLFFRHSLRYRRQGRRFACAGECFNTHIPSTFLSHFDGKSLLFSQTIHSRSLWYWRKRQYSHCSRRIPFFA
jgi:hypothetical protein